MTWVYGLLAIAVLAPCLVFAFSSADIVPDDEDDGDL